MAQYVYCKGHKPSCQGYRLAEILSIFVYTPGKPGRGSEDAACAVSGFDSRISLLTAAGGLLKFSRLRPVGFPTELNNDNRQNCSSVRWRENYRRTGITPFIFIYQTFPYIVWKGYGTAGA